MAYTLTDYEALKTAIASGVKRVKYADRDVEYQSIEDMLKVLSLMAAELGLVAPGPRFTYFETHKGV